ncbi:hypothetical protein GWK47_049718 [Chionoecetes opilio]|uniref:Uncharacterized protein n=1 Tax=Chionoecetes opilio TaxID=41210 RepID=A0A8J4Y3U2_CHIOP|nr:hypothetical protein GWK47_049718 [Chionoecetes opilio]
MHTVSVSLPKVSKKMESVPMEACFIADKYAISNRAVTELAAAFRKDGGKNLEEYNLSVNTTGRRRQSARLEKAADITKWQLGDITSKMYALHWDGKLIKSLMHVGKDMERVAVILTGTDGQEVLLSIVGLEGRSTAENEAAKIIQVLNDHPLDTSRIGALVFDTTAVNSGVWSGVVVRLETEFGRSLLQLASLSSSPLHNGPPRTNYRHGKKVVANLPVVNDAAERALGLATDLNTNKAPKSEEQLQALCRVVKGVREKLHGLATSTEVVTKKSLASISYSWD